MIKIVEKKNPILGEYDNGNYHVTIYEDGTKVRETFDENATEFIAEYPECMDVKITNRCNKGCHMCFVAGTKILMADFSYKNIEDIKIGDIVLGFEEKAEKNGAKRKVKASKVLNTFIHVESELVEVKTSNGGTVISTPNHPFLTEGTGKNHSRIFNQIERVPVGHFLFEYGFPIDEVDYNSENYKLGYMVASWAGDGCYFKSIDKNGFDVYNCRFVTLDEEINDKVFEVSSYFIPDFYRLDFKMTGKEERIRSSVRSNKKSVYDAIVKYENDNIGVNNSKEYICGFLAGFMDSEGGGVDNGRSCLRLFNTNMKYINEVKRCLDYLSIDYIQEYRPATVGHKACYTIRVKGQYGVVKFLWYARPVCKRKSLENYMLYSTHYYKHILQEKNIINKKQYVYNLETETHTYIANNFMVHNCHEDSKPDGEHGEILTAKFWDTLKPYTEIAIGGGDPLSHPDLVTFLIKLKNLKLIPNMTVNQTHFMQNWALLKFLCEEKLIYGLGVSLVESTEDFIEKIKEFPNAVIHIINGVVKKEQLAKLANNDLKVLILGYKEFRRGVTYLEEHLVQVEMNKMALYDYLPDMLNEFKVVSFDNLALEQLEVKRLLTEEEWNEFYMGNDGKYTMYIDLVKEQFALCSVAEERFDLLDDIKPMFEKVKSLNV